MDVIKLFIMKSGVLPIMQNISLARGFNGISVIHPKCGAVHEQRPMSNCCHRDEEPECWNCCSWTSDMELLILVTYFGRSKKSNQIKYSLNNLTSGHLFLYFCSLPAAGGFGDVTTTKMSDIEKIEKKKEGRRLEMVYNTTDLLDRLLDGYDRKLRPNFGGPIMIFIFTTAAKI